jgi:hypothetical protein
MVRDSIDLSDFSIFILSASSGFAVSVLNSSYRETPVSEA